MSRFNIQQFNAKEIETKAMKLFSETHELDGYRMLFETELLDWSDFYSENGTTLSEAENLAMIDAITDLWILFANFESQRNQFKRAIEVFDQSMNHPVVGRGAKIYQSYAKYCMSRNKPGIAQKGFIRGLTANLSVENSDNLWFSLLDLTQSITKNKSYSLLQLYDEVCSQLSTSDLPKLAPLPVATKALTSSTPSLPSTSLKASATAPEVRAQPATSQQQAAPIITQVIPVNTDKKPVPVALHHAAPDEHDSLYDMPPDQMIRVFRLRPPMIFVAPNKEPMVSGVQTLSEEEVDQLERFLGISLVELSDFEDNMSTQRQRAEYYLDLLEELWYCQALKERHFEAWALELKKLHGAEERLLLNRLTALKANITTDHPDIIKLRKRAVVQNELFIALINKTMYSLLIEQEKMLSEIAFPGFSRNFVLSMETALNQRRSTLQQGNASALKSIPFFDANMAKEIVQQRKFVCALLSIRLNMLQDRRLKQRAGSMSQGRSKPLTPTNQRQQSAGTDLSFAESKEIESDRTTPEKAVDHQLPRGERSNTISSEMSEAMTSPGEGDDLAGDDPSTPRSASDGKKKKRRRRTMVSSSVIEGFDGSDSLHADGMDIGEDGVEAPLLKRQFSNTYSDSSIDSYSQSLIQQENFLDQLNQQYVLPAQSEVSSIPAIFNAEDLEATATTAMDGEDDEDENAMFDQIKAIMEGRAQQS